MGSIENWAPPPVTMDDYAPTPVDGALMEENAAPTIDGYAPPSLDGYMPPPVPDDVGIQDSPKFEHKATLHFKPKKKKPKKKAHHGSKSS